MSYLKQYNKKVPNRGSNENSDANYHEKDGVIQAKFTFLKLSTYSAQSVINSLSQNVQALDLSHNKIEYFPSFIPKTIIGLNLSNNVIESINIGKPFTQVIELNLSHNRITSTAGLAPLLNLQFLELSFNSISIIEGLESMKNLQVLKLQGNHIAVVSSIRSLTCNQMLTDIDLSNNPICESKEFKLLMLNFLPQVKLLNKSPVRKRGAGVGYSDIATNNHHPRIPSENNHNLSFQSTETQKDQLIELWKEIAKDESLWASSIPPDILQRIKQLVPEEIVEEEEEEPSVHSEEPIEEPTIKRNNNLPWRRAPNPLPRPAPPKKVKPKTPDPPPVQINKPKKKETTKKEKPEMKTPTVSMLDEIIHDMDLSPQESIIGTSWMSPRLQKRREREAAQPPPPPIPPPSFQYITQWDVETEKHLEDGDDDQYSINTYGSSQNHSKFRTPNRSHTKSTPVLPIDSSTYRLNLVDNAKHSPTRSSILRAKTIAKKLQDQKVHEDDYKRRKTFATSPAPSRYKQKEKSTQVEFVDEEIQCEENDNENTDINNQLLIEQPPVEEVVDTPCRSLSPFNRLLRLKEKIDKRLGITNTTVEEVIPANAAYRYLQDFENSLDGVDQFVEQFQDPMNTSLSHNNMRYGMLDNPQGTPATHPLLMSSGTSYPSSTFSLRTPTTYPAPQPQIATAPYSNSFFISPLSIAQQQQPPLDATQLVRVPERPESIDVNTEGERLSNALASLREKKLRSLQSLSGGQEIPSSSLQYSAFASYPSSSSTSMLNPSMNPMQPADSAFNMLTTTGPTDSAMMFQDMSQASIASNLDLNDSKTPEDILEAIDKLRKQRLTTIKMIRHTR